MTKYQPRHAKKKVRGNEYTPAVWTYSFMLGVFVAAMLARFVHGVVTLSWAASFARVFGIAGALTVVFAFIMAGIYLSYIARIERHNEKVLAEIFKHVRK